MSPVERVTQSIFCTVESFKSVDSVRLTSVTKDVAPLFAGKEFVRCKLFIQNTSQSPTTHLTVFARDDAVFADTESAVCAQS